jgi:hypothetical protein
MSAAVLAGVGQSLESSVTGGPSEIRPECAATADLRDVTVGLGNHATGGDGT